eukprot:gene8440-266_t
MLANSKKLLLKEWRCKPGSMSSLYLKETSVDEIKTMKNQLLIKTCALGLNFADVISVLGLYEAAPKEEFTPGLEFSGIVVKTFEGSKYKVGDKVIGVKRFYAFANYIPIEEHFVKPLPEGWSLTEGAAFLVQVLTAWYGLVELGGLKKNQKVIVHSAAGGVGQYSLDIIKHFGSHAIATIGSDNKKETLIKEKGLKESQIIVRTNASEFKSQVEKAVSSISTNEKGVDMVMDSLGGDYFQPGYDLLNLGGRIILFGWGSMIQHGNSPNYLTLGWNYYWRPKLDPLQMIVNLGENKGVFGFNLIHWFSKESFFTDLWDELIKVDFQKPKINQFKFEDAPKEKLF